MALGREDIEYFSQELSEYAKKENSRGSSIYCMHNESLSDELFAYFRNQFDNMKQWKLPQGQFFTFGEKGEREIVQFLHKSIAEKKRLVEEMENILKAVNLD